MKPYMPELFWAERGVEPALRDEEEDKFILGHLNKLSFKSVLDIGCGDGRMADLIFKNFNIERYVGIDLSKDRLMMLEKKSYPATLVYGDYLKTIFPQFDLIIASHVLLHIHPFNIKDFIRKMTNESKHIIHIDYFPVPGKEHKEMEYYNFLHPYPELYPDTNKLNIYRYSDQVALFHYAD